MAIHLRPIALEDGKSIVKWRNDEKVREHCLTKSVITEASNEVFFHEFVETGKYKQFIVEFADMDFPVTFYPVASVYLKDMDYENKRCELCIFTSSDREWDSESKSEGIKLLLDKAFNEYGMHKVYSYVFYKFLDEVELLKSAGFSIESILKEEAAGENGKFEDIVRLSVIKDEF